MDAQLSDLIGKTMKSVTNESDERILFTSVDGESWAMQHIQNCCESVSVEDIVGSLEDLVGSPIVRAEENTSETDPEGITKTDEYRESFTWTFYRLGTAKGTVVIRWYGTSNGYYSESVDFDRVT